MNCSRMFLGLIGVIWCSMAFATQPNYQVWLGERHACGIDDDGFKCWGQNEFSQASGMRIGNVQQVGLGDKHTCVLDESGVLCWGADHNQVPPLENPKYLSSDNTASCAIDQNGLQCWAGTRSVEDVMKDATQSNLPFFGPKLAMRSIVGTYKTKIWEVSCLIQNKEATCELAKFEENYEPYIRQLKLPPLKNPRQIVADSEKLCALDDDGVTCWTAWIKITEKIPGWYSNYYLEPVSDPSILSTPTLTKPMGLLSNQNYTCAIDVTGLICWAAADASKLTPTESVPINPSYKMNFTWYQTGPFLQKLSAGGSSNERALYFSKMLKFYKSFLKNDFYIEFQWQLMSLLKPAIESVDSEPFRSTIIPEYQKLMGAMESFLSKRNLKTEIEDSALYRQLVLINLKAALQMASDLLSPEARQNLILAKRATDQAIDNQSDQMILQALKQIEIAQPTLLPLGQSKDTDFALQTISISVRHLKSWTQH